MADPFHHAVSSVRKWGGSPGQYLHIHKWYDESKALLPDFRHRALRHHSEGIELSCEIFGQAVPIYLDLCVACNATGALVVDSRGYHGICRECEGRGYDIKGQVRHVPLRWIGEQHVKEDMGRIPSAVDWLRCIKPEEWMNRPLKLSRTLEREVKVD